MEAAFSAKAKELGNKIVSDIKDQFIRRIKTLEWMDDEVKALAIEKVNAIVQKIGYPDKVSSHQKAIAIPDADIFSPRISWTRRP